MKLPKSLRSCNSQTKLLIGFVLFVQMIVVIEIFVVVLLTKFLHFVR